MKEASRSWMTGSKEGNGNPVPQLRLDEEQTGINITGGNTNKLRYADDTTLMAESEQLNSLLMKVKEERKSWL